MNFRRTIEKESVILAEGAIVERLRRDETIQLDPRVLHAGLIYDAKGREVMAAMFHQYIDIAQEHDLPIVINTPTWRANPERLRDAGFSASDDVNGDGVRFVADIRDSYREYRHRIHIGGLIACRGDAYDPKDALPEKEAASFHRRQVRALRDAGVDYLAAATLPALSEAVGIARAFAECEVPYILSFAVRPTGTLLDGTPLGEAVARIDATVEPKPLGYMANCVHPTVLAEALEVQSPQFANPSQRMIGLQANTSTKSPEELDGLAHLDAGDPPDCFADAMLSLHRRFGLKILGGCCGTDDRHIRCIAERIRGKVSPQRNTTK